MIGLYLKEDQDKLQKKQIPPDDKPWLDCSSGFAVIIFAPCAKLLKKSAGCIHVIGFSLDCFALGLKMWLTRVT